MDCFPNFPSLLAPSCGLQFNTNVFSTSQRTELSQRSLVLRPASPDFFPQGDATVSHTGDIPVLTYLGEELLAISSLQLKIHKSHSRRLVLTFIRRWALATRTPPLLHQSSPRTAPLTTRSLPPRLQVNGKYQRKKRYR